jgi:hypothetical protein
VRSLATATVALLESLCSLDALGCMQMSSAEEKVARGPDQLD